MASITKRSNGLYIVRFINLRGERKTLSLGTRSERQADTVCKYVENLLTAAKLSEQVDPLTASWLEQLKAPLRKKLVKAGLLGEREPEPVEDELTLGAFLTTYFEKRSDVKPATKINWGHTRRNLLEFFTADKPLAKVTAGDAEDFERFLKGTARENRYAEREKEEPLSAATVRKRISNCKQFFRNAVRREWITKNPFEDLASAVNGNVDRQFFVSREATDKILAACPDIEWRLLVSLARYGGLRTPSESLSLRWTNINWETGRILVHSPKTEHHEGKATREVPLFPELRDLLWEAHTLAPDGTEFVINRWRGAAQKTDGGWKNCNLRTHFERIIKRAEVKPWPKLWQNLRSTCQTELEEFFPSHAVCDWMGNSIRVAQKHYLQTTDDHFEQAKSGAHLARSIFVASDAMQMVVNENAGDAPIANIRKKVLSPALGMGVTGFEPVTSSV